MRRLAFFAPLAAVVAAASMAQAQPANVTVSIGADLQKEVAKLGEREVQQQVDDLTRRVERTLTERNALEGAQVNLILTDLKPNRPTFQQLTDRPGLDAMRSVSIGGAAFEGEVITADGQHLPIKYSRYSSTIAEVTGFTTWQDASTAYARLANNLASGRLEQR